MVTRTVVDWLDSLLYSVSLTHNYRHLIDIESDTFFSPEFAYIPTDELTHHRVA